MRLPGTKFASYHNTFVFASIGNSLFCLLKLTAKLIFYFRLITSQHCYGITIRYSIAQCLYSASISYLFINIHVAPPIAYNFLNPSPRFLYEQVMPEDSVYVYLS